MAPKADLIIKLTQSGKTPNEVASLLNIHRATVYRAVSKFKASGSTDPSPRIGKPRTVRTKNMIRAVRNRIKYNPVRSINKMAKDLNLSETIVHKMY